MFYNNYYELQLKILSGMVEVFKNEWFKELSKLKRVETF